MTQPSSEYQPATTDGDVEAYADAVAVAFNWSRDEALAFARRGPREDVRLVRDAAGEALGGLNLIRMGQFWGGRSVPHVGIGGVVVVPEARGRGVGKLLMRSAIDELAREGVAMSGLFPATWPVYRDSGFEVAGGRWRVRLRPRELKPRPGPADEARLGVRRVGRAEHGAVRDACARFARHTPGHMDRGPYIWEHGVFRSGNEPTRVYVVESPDDASMEGYVAVHMSRSAELGGSVVEITDMVALTPRAGRALWSFLAGHWSMAVAIEWNCGPGHPMLGLLHDRTFEMRLLEHWMIRLVDLGGALEARGYAPNVTDRIAIDVRGDRLDANNGVWLLDVAEGRARAERVEAKAEVRVEAGALASIYAGYLNPLAARTEAGVWGAPDALARLAGLFVGPMPWMSEIY